MAPKDIIESGLLELYVLNQLAEAERREVEGYVLKYPELKQEIQDIERALVAIGREQGLNPAQGAKENLMSKVRADRSPTTSKYGKVARNLLWLAAASIAALTFFWNNERSKGTEWENNYTILQSDCDSLRQEMANQQRWLEVLLDPGNQILAFDATPKYPGTKLYLHLNAQNATNHIQVVGLPELAAGKTFQLWSLQADSDPQPLNVFSGGDPLIEVDFIEETQAYAITIENEGGSQIPTLDDLIGVANVAG